MLTKKKRRSGQGFFSLSSASIPSPSSPVKVSGMDDPRATIGNSAANDSIQDREGAEPLVENLGQVHADEQHAPVQDCIFQSGTELDKDRPASITSDHSAAAPPPDFTRRGIHIPLRTSSHTATLKKRFFRRSSSLPPEPSPVSNTTGPSTGPMATTAGSSSMRENSLRSSADSVLSYETRASSIATQQLGPLQAAGPAEAIERLSPLLEDDPFSYDLTAPAPGTSGKPFNLETRSEQLFSKEHLEAIFRDTPSLLRFTSFLSNNRPKAVPVLIYYLDSLKALRAIQYANAVAEALEPIDGREFTEHAPRSTVNAVLEDKAQQAFDILVRDELPAFITHIYIQLVSVSIHKRVTGTLPVMLREASEGLAEVFCLTDPSRDDNPIIFASEEFHRTTQYGVSFVIGRNCRFLQGPMTNRATTARLRDAVKNGKELSEVFLNYRRDGSPFMNLLMMAPLIDSRGKLRYFIGAQVDVSGLVKDCTDLEAFKRYLNIKEGLEDEDEPKDEFQELSEMFNHSELETVRHHGGNMHREHIEQDSVSIRRPAPRSGPRVLIKDEAAAVPTINKADGRLEGVYKHYLLIRPAPSLRILFVSPSLRVPGILQSRFLDRIGGNQRIRNSVAEALTDSSRGVTAKIRWLTTAAANLDSGHVEEGRPRWIHCTPLLGQTGQVGVWMVVLVDDEKQPAPSRRFRQAPPVASEVRRPQQQKSYPNPMGLDSDDERDTRPAMNSRQPTNGSIPHRRMPSATSDPKADQQRSSGDSMRSHPSRSDLRNGITKTTHLAVSSRPAELSRAGSEESVLTQDFGGPSPVKSPRRLGSMTPTRGLERNAMYGLA